MKNRILLIFSTGLMLLSGCRKLDVKIESDLTPSNFPSTPDAYVAATGPVYSQLAFSASGYSFAVEYWRMQEFSTEEAIIPARGGNYDDGGQYRFLHLHTWTADHPNVRSEWEWGFGGINTCNRLLNLFNKTPDNDAKYTAIAEMKAMRALFYFFMMDLYGNVPIIDSFPVPTPPGTSSRADVFAFIEKDLKAAIPYLNAQAGAYTYGRPTKWLAFALLEKIYLNAEYYLGTSKYTETVAMADSILANGPYSLAASYTSIFMPDNGPQVKETIFAIPYDPFLIQGNHFTRYGLHPYLQAKYSIPFRPSIAMSTLKEFYAKFNLPNDIRNSTWLVGKQYNVDGSPIMINTTEKTLDASYSGTDYPIQWQVEFSPDLTLLYPETMDVGNDILAQCKGIRSIKFYPDKNSNPDSRYQGNDFPMLRLADVILMKAEAILRGAAPTNVNGELQTADVLVNKIRARAGTDPVSGIDLQGLLDERARELAWEGWRRNDLIRFGQFENSWGFKTNNETYRRIYPVPSTELSLNPKLVQNPGYQ